MAQEADRGAQGAGAGEGDDEDREVAGGGADAIQKTTYVTGRGTDPDATSGPGPAARVSGGAGANPVLWAVIALAAIVALVYGFGILS